MPPEGGIAAAEVGGAGHRPPLKLIGKAVPQIVVEFAEPWKIIAERPALHHKRRHLTSTG
jgi:hypothetical protein